MGVIGLMGLMGLMGLIGLIGPIGLIGSIGLMGLIGFTDYRLLITIFWLVVGEFWLFAVGGYAVDGYHDDADGDGGVGDVEYCVEEEEILATPDGNPVGPSEAEEGEIEHIDDTAEEEGGITALGREELRHMVVAVVEYEAIEAAVDEVADGADEDEREGDDE